MVFNINRHEKKIFEEMMNKLPNLGKCGLEEQRLKRPLVHYPVMKCHSTPCLRADSILPFHRKPPRWTDSILKYYILEFHLGLAINLS